jgi:DNA-binding GntR family transcriptional regulator
MLTRAETVATELRRLIHQGDLEPGSPLRQVDIARRFEVSTTPVREAFAALAKEGLVVQDAHRGAVVFSPSVADLYETYEIRMALEPLATELAASRLHQSDLEELDRIVDDMYAAVADNDIVQYDTVLNRRFHALIYRAADRPRLADMIDVLRDTSAVYIRVLRAQQTRDDLEAVQTEHEAILAALHARAGKPAAKLMRAHLANTVEQMLASMPAARANRRAKARLKSV